MSMCGIIAEYDPFHNGHAFHVDEARRLSGCASVICVMSGPFLQRGVQSMFTQFDRARMALYGGIDAVWLLPYGFAVREAEHFALGGVCLLEKLGATHISFGCETDDLPLLSDAAALLEQEPPSFSARVREILDTGASHASAVGTALQETLGISSNELSLPNNMLAISYLRVLSRMHSSMIPVPVKRLSNYHASTLSYFPSAKAIRRSILLGNEGDLGQYMPARCAELLRDILSTGRYSRENAGDAILFSLLSRMSPQQLSEYPDCREGLENRIIRLAREMTSRDELISAVVSRRYTASRVSRLLCHVLTETKESDLTSMPEYTRLLGIRKSVLRSIPCFEAAEVNGVELVSRPARAKASSFRVEMNACRIDALLRGFPFASPYREQCIIASDL